MTIKYGIECVHCGNEYWNTDFNKVDDWACFCDAPDYQYMPSEDESDRFE